MKDLLEQNLWKALVFGCIMTVIGFFNGSATFTIPPVWFQLFRLFTVYTVTFYAISVLVDRVAAAIKRKKHQK